MRSCGESPLTPRYDYLVHFEASPDGLAVLASISIKENVVSQVLSWPGDIPDHVVSWLCLSRWIEGLITEMGQQQVGSYPSQPYCRSDVRTVKQ
jgi:hypothetical protein